MITRRRFLAAMGLTGAGSIAFGLCGCSPFSRPTFKAAAPTTARFLTRPDLHPPLVSTSIGGPVGTGLIFITAAGPLIVDNEGSMVWYQALPSGTSVADFKVQQYKGQPVITWWQGKILAGYGQGVHMLVNAQYQPLRTIQAANGYQADLHDLQLTPEGTALLTVYRQMPADLSSVGGSTGGTVLEGIVQEIDLATGQVLLEWHSRDHVALSESYATLPKAPNQPYDYFHINSVAVGPDGNLLISARNTWSIYKIDRTSGGVLWRLGGKQSDFALGPGVPFSFQHDPRWHGRSTLTLFDDGAGPPNVESRSRGLRLELDEVSKTVTLSQQFVHSPEVLATSQGNVQVLDNGNVFVGWGSEPIFGEYTATGQQVFNGQLAADQSYRAFRFPWVGMPDEPPRAVARSSGVGTVDVFVSWSGATEVTRWEVLAGSADSSLVPVASGRRVGFETRISVKTTASHVAVRALDQGGRVLGVSPTMAA